MAAPVETTNVRRPHIVFLTQVDLGGRGEKFWIGAVRWTGPKIGGSANTDMPRPAVTTAATTATVWELDYDNEASGPFTLGETITASGGKSGVILKLTDDGSTGTIIYKLTGSNFADDDPITGGTSSATADVNGTPTDLDTVNDYAYLSSTTTFAPQIVLPQRDWTDTPDDIYKGTADAIPDGLFFIRELDNGVNEFVVWPHIAAAGGDGLWDFTQVRDVHGNANLFEDKAADFPEPRTDFHGILTNGIGAPIHIGRYKDNQGTPKVQPTFAPYFPNNVDLPVRAGIGDPTSLEAIETSGGADSATFAITAVRSTAVYNGSLCYAGFSAWNPKDNATMRKYPNWALFSQPIGTEWGLHQVDWTSAVKIGDSPSEPIMKVATTSMASDSMGIRGALAFFTPKKVVVFDGLPPIPGDENDTGFTSVALGDVGCIGGETVQPTPYGLVFLGTDGMIYLLPADRPGQPRPIGRAIQPALEKLPALRHRRCTATYFDNHYMLSFPTGGHTFKEYWADMRRYRPGAPDEGITWVGPMTGRNISSFAVGRQGSSREVLMGAEEGGAVVSMLHQAQKTSDPLGRFRHESEVFAETDEIPIKVRAISNPVDLGSIHDDKIVRKVKVGVGCDDEVDVTIGVSMIGSTIGSDANADGFLFENSTETVTPAYGKADTVLFGEPVQPDDEVRSVDVEFGQRLRGKAAVIDIREEPGSSANKDPKVKLSDIELFIKKITRE